MFNTYLINLKHMLNMTHILHMYFADAFKICIKHVDLDVCLIHVKNMFYLCDLEYVFNTCGLFYVYVTPSIITYMCSLSPRFVIKGNAIAIALSAIFTLVSYIFVTHSSYFIVCTLFTYVFTYVISSTSHKHARFAVNHTKTFPYPFPLTFSAMHVTTCIYIYIFFKCLSYL